MVWIYDPSAWLGLLTLTILEIVLGIDNLVFIAILAGKLPSKKWQDRARYTGLGFALLLRLVVISFISWIVTLTNPILSFGTFGISVRDLILLIGGIFLLYKATSELHEKLEGGIESTSTEKFAANKFWLVVLQIVVLDAVFSLDSVITAVGMCEHVFIMMFAVIIAMAIMVSLSNILTKFINSHPSLVILCLSFLLMIGFSLVAEGLHIHVPKGYLYAAIGFSILIEIFNQVARKNNLKLDKNLKSNREIAASLVLRILGSKSENEFQSIKESIVAPVDVESVFANEEKDLVSRVLQLDAYTVRAVMTARIDVEMLDISDSREEIYQLLINCPYSLLVAYNNDNKDAPIGYVKKSKILEQMIVNKGDIDFSKMIMQPLYVPETISVLKALEEMKAAKNYILFVVDEFGNFEGLATIRDIMEEIAGNLPEKSEKEDCKKVGEDSYIVQGDIALIELDRLIGINIEPSVHYHSIAGYIIEKEQNLPKVNSIVELNEDWQCTILNVENHSISSVMIHKISKNEKKPNK
ncbi:MAG: transporter associated domain-containing protein [Succinivibrionaceae bacterium]